MDEPESREDRGSPGAARPRGFFLALIATVFLSLLPIALARIPPLGDYPNHLARFHILARYGEEAWMREFWQVVWEPLPNLGVDLLAIAIAKLFPIVLAGRITLGLIVLIHGFGFFLLSREWAGRATYWSLLGIPLAYTHPMLKGFLNYQLGVGLLCGALAVHLRVRQRGLAPYALVMAPLSTLLMLAHLQAFGMFLVLIGAIEFGLARSGERAPLSVRELALRYLVLIPIPAAYFAVGSGRGEITGVNWSSVEMKTKALLKVFSQGDLPLDLLVGVLFVGLLATARLSGVRISRPGWMAVLTLIALFLVLPHGFRSTHWADTRVVTAIFLMAFAFVVPVRSPLLDASILLFVVVRLLVVATSYERRGAQLDRVDIAISRLPTGSLIFTYFLDTSVVMKEREWEPPLMHAASLGAVTNQIYPVQLFVFPGQQTLTVRPEFRGVVTRSHLDDSDAPGQWVSLVQARRRTLPLAWQSRPVYVLFRHGKAEAPSPTGASPVARDATWTIYRLADLSKR